MDNKRNLDCVSEERAGNRKHKVAQGGYCGKRFLQRQVKESGTQVIWIWEPILLAFFVQVNPPSEGVSNQTH